ncbi:MAG: DUF3768 domain-containing protein [Hyphomicrobiales bacterium]
MSDAENREKIAHLNDVLRHTFLTGTVVLTNGVQALPDETRERVLTHVRCFDDFDLGNYPHGERDFGGFNVDGQGYFWKIDYYDFDLKFLSPDPADPNVTKRVLTIMLADEY